MITRTFLSDRQRQRRPVTIRMDGQALRGLRLSLGWTQAEFAERIGKTKPYVCHLERERVMPSVATAEDIVNVLGHAAADSGALVMEWQ